MQTLTLTLMLTLLLTSTEVKSEQTNQQVVETSWRLVHEDLNEYELVKSATVRSESECAFWAVDEPAMTFSRDSRVCRVFVCRMGISGCRKCRNMRNSSLPNVWLRVSSSDNAGCWQTFQHRVDDSVDFYRNWTQYLTEFGQNEDKNFWMGLRRIHELTAGGDRPVRWEFSLWNDTFYWAENSFLQVEGEETNFTARVGEFRSNRSSIEMENQSDGTIRMNGMKFSTFDRDNDVKSTNCAVEYTGAWWYSDCHAFNPNGRYYNPPTALSLTGSLRATGLTWFFSGSVWPFNREYSMKTFECLVWLKDVDEAF